MRILITGGAGFLGGHLAARLLADGHEPTALDDLSTGRAENLPAGVPLLREDARRRDRVAAAVAECDAVFHLAAAVGPELVALDPVGTWSRNVEGTASVLDACALYGRRVLVASTSEVYGTDPEALEGPLREQDPVTLDPAGRRDVYAISKAAGEAYALALHRSRLLPVTVARCFNVVGARQSERYGMVLARFSRSARAGEPLTVYGDGTQRRCFLHVADAVEALMRLLVTPAAEGLVVNVGSDEEVSVLDLATMVIEESGSRAGVVFIPFHHVYGEGFPDPRRRLPDLARLRRLTAFAPLRSLRDAVHDVLATSPAVR